MVDTMHPDTLAQPVYLCPVINILQLCVTCQVCPKCMFAHLHMVQIVHIAFLCRLIEKLDIPEGLALFPRLP